MLADHAARVTAIGAGFGTEAGSLGGNLDREIGFLQHLARDGVRERHFSGRDQILELMLSLFLISADAGRVKVLSKLRQLTGSIHGRRIDDVRRIAFGVAMLPGVKIEHELREGAVQMSDLTLHEAETGAGKLGSRIEIHAKRRSHINVVLHREIELTGGAPAPLFNIRTVITANRTFRVRQIRNALKQIVQLVADFAKLFLEVSKLFRQSGSFLHQIFCRFARLLGLSDLTGQGVTHSLQFFSLRLNLLTLIFKSEEFFLRELKVAGLQPSNHFRQLFAQKIDVNHGEILWKTKSRAAVLFSIYKIAASHRIRANRS